MIYPIGLAKVDGPADTESFLNENGGVIFIDIKDPELSNTYRHRHQ